MCEHLVILRQRPTFLVFRKFPTVWLSGIMRPFGWACCNLSGAEGVSTVCVFLFMYVEVPVRWVGIVRLKPFQPCDTTRSGSSQITGLVSHISNEYNISKPILDQKKKKEKRWMCSQMSNYQVYYPLQNYKWVCQVCLRRHCCLWVWRPSWTVWDPGSKKKGSLPLTWPWIFPNAQLYHRSPFSPEWLWQAASVVMALNFGVIAISKWWGMTRQPNREKKKSQREWNHRLRGGFFFFFFHFQKGRAPCCSFGRVENCVECEALTWGDRVQRVMRLSRDECLCWGGRGVSTREVGGCGVRGKRAGAFAAGEGD